MPKQHASKTGSARSRRLPFGVTGTVRLVTARSDEHWSPAASIYAQGSTPTEEVGLRFVVSENNQSQLDLELVDSAKSQETRAIGALPAAETVVFALEIRSTGTMTASVNGEPHTLDFSGFTMRKVGLVCSTGTFAFDKVSVEGTDGYLTSRWSGP